MPPPSSIKTPAPPAKRKSVFPLAGPWPLEHSPLSWAEVWQQLVRADIRFKSCMWAEARCIVTFRKHEGNQRQFALTGREEAVFHRTLLGQRQKVIAQASEVATSTVANSLKSAMLKLGFRSRLEAAPLAALTLTYASSGAVADPTRRLFSVGQGAFVMATTTEPKWSRFAEVTGTEQQICKLVIQGRSNEDIAAARQTSVHTVENQLGSLCRKLRANGRFDLIRVLYCS